MYKSLFIAALTVASLSPIAVLAQASSYPSSPEQIQPATITDPQQFATKAGAAGLFEIQSSQLALTKLQNADIKAFAQMMIDDHTKAGSALKAEAGTQGVTVPDAP